MTDPHPHAPSTPEEASGCKSDDMKFLHDNALDCLETFRSRVFRPGEGRRYKLTLLARCVDVSDGSQDILATADDDDKIIEALKRISRMEPSS